MNRFPLSVDAEAHHVLMPMQTLIILILLTILASLGSAMFYLVKDRSRSPRTVKALTFRIGLSIFLFLLLLLGYALGILQPHGLHPGGRPTASNPTAGTGNSGQTR